MDIVTDFETYSPVSITAGSYKYASHPKADIVMLGLKLGVTETDLWEPGKTIFNVGPEDTVYAHNALFDYLIWHKIGVPRYDFPEVPLDQWVDTQALCNRYTFPGKLAAVGDILDLDVQKSPRGRALIKKICVPTKDGRRPELGRDYTNNEYIEFMEYCKDDVNTTYELIHKLPSKTLTIAEQAYWELTQRMNMAGLPVDIKAVEVILSYVEMYSKDLSLRVPEITNGQVDKVTQVQRMRQYLCDRGVSVDNLQAATVEKLLQQNLPDDVKELLELRQQIGRSSTAKYRKIQLMEHNGRVYNNLHYHGTSTGRWAGRGFQLQNLPRASVSDPDSVIDDFLSFKPIDDAVNVAKALIRPMIRAPKGHKLIVSDYSSIENRLLAWVAGDEDSLELFRKGGDQYVEMASSLYNTTTDAVSKAQRQIGKIIILGCGYGMGPKRFVETAESWGVDMSHGEADVAVKAYRNKYHMVRTLWRVLKECAIDAIKYPGKPFSYNGVSFRHVRDKKSDTRWLVMTLPSDRNVFYNSPYLEDTPYGMNPGHYGINPYTKKWSRLKLIPGRITENVIQALARDIMAHGLMQIDKLMPEVTLTGTVHDEAIAEAQEDHIDDSTMDRFNKHLCTLPSWARGLPLEAEGWIGERYRK